MRAEAPEPTPLPEPARPDESLLPPVEPATVTPEVNPPSPTRSVEPPATADAEMQAPPALETPATADLAAEIPEVVVPRAEPAEPDPTPVLPGMEAGPQRLARSETPVSDPEAAPALTAPRSDDRSEVPPASLSANLPDAVPATRLEPPRAAPPLTAAEPSVTPAPGGGDGEAIGPEIAAMPAPIPAAAPGTAAALPGLEAPLRLRPGRVGAGNNGGERPPLTRPGTNSEPIEIARARPSGALATPGLPRAVLGRRPLPEVPEVYRPRLDPNRSLRAQRAGASLASEQAVERALDWLKRHQDADGRWDAGTAKYRDGTVPKGEDDFTVHCPPGETCFGECFYWEADTAMTGLALLAYLGAGYTHTDGKYAETVDRGLRFLLSIQKADGDLRGRSVAVGMYCHAMASLAICEAYALTGDPMLRGPAERAVNFIVHSRAADGMAWRDEPGARTGDTSILGWIILVLKSARETDITVPEATRAGAVRWLRLIAEGRNKGLATYQPNEKITPTMTAEAWVCRQFLGVADPGAESLEAASFLLDHGPDTDPYNLYYWYYGTLSMFQYGGTAWDRWNGQVRDRIVGRQRTTGHQAGSWDPDESPWGTRGGRIYCTALATLTLEVYYRYLRLYGEDEPARTPILAPKPDTQPADGGLRRAVGNTPTPAPRRP